MVSRAWLSRFIEDVRVVEHDVPQPIVRLPDGRTNVIFRLHEGARSGDLTASGPRTRALFKAAHGGIARTILIAIKPGWSTQLLGVPGHALTDRIVYLDDLWGRAGTNLCAELLAARSTADVVDRLSHAIALRSERTVEPASAQLARRAVRLIDAGENRVDRVAERLGVTPRHLRRAFAESVGVGPKAFARTVRLHRALRSAATSQDWGRVAIEAGYYDQAHLITDFRDLVGLTPGAFASYARAAREQGGV